MATSPKATTAVALAIIGALGLIGAALINSGTLKSTEKVRVFGYVRDRDGTGIDDVDLSLEVGGAPLTTRSASNGWFEFTLKKPTTDDVSISAEKPGYKRTTLGIKVASDQPVMIALRKIEVPIPQDTPRPQQGNVLTPADIKGLKSAGYNAIPAGNNLYFIEETFFKRRLDLAPACEARRLLNGTPLETVVADRKPLIDLLAGQPFPGGIVPANRLSPELLASIYSQRVANCR